MTSNVPPLTSATRNQRSETDTKAAIEDRLRHYDDQSAAERAMLALDAGRMGTWRWDIVNKTITADPQGATHMGLDYNAQPWGEEVGYQVIHPDDLEWVGERSQAALEGADQYEAVFREAPREDLGPDQPVFWLGVRGRVTKRAADGSPLEMIGVNWDATGEKQQEEKLRFLAGEMDHRIRNAFAIVQAMIGLGSRQSTDIKTFTNTLRQQVQAMADTHAISAKLAREDTQTTAMGLNAILSQALKPWLNSKGPRAIRAKVSLNCPDDITLHPRVMSSMAMILYELTTNATKYGAMSASGGELAVQVKANDAGGFTLTWQEDLSKIAPEQRGKPLSDDDWVGGFGATLLNQCAITLQAELVRDVTPDGVRYAVTVPAH